MALETKGPTFGGVVLDHFLLEEQSAATLTYVGIGREIRGTPEEDFRRMVEEMRQGRPGLEYQLVGMTLGGDIADPSSPVYRGSGFSRLETGNIHTKVEVPGILFLPDFPNWYNHAETGNRVNLRAHINRCSEGGGVILYQAGQALAKRMGLFGDVDSLQIELMTEFGPEHVKRVDRRIDRSVTFAVRKPGGRYIEQ